MSPKMGHSKMNVILQCCAVLFLTVTLSNTANAESHWDCITPDFEKGLCTVVTDCQSHVQKINNLTEENRNYLRRAQCGWEGRIPKSCCSIVKKGKELLPEQCYYGKDQVILENRITGGESTENGEHPWIARIETKVNNNNRRGNLFCAGVIINKRYILTAAHCAVDYDMRKYFNIVVGVNDVSTADPTDQVIPVEEVFVHEKYEERFPFDNDIALVRLAREIRINYKAHPICLPEKEINLLEDYVESAGWGKTEAGTVSQKLLKVTLKEVDRATCERSYSRINQGIGTNMICAKGVQAGGDTCSGDSGGPLVIRSDDFIAPTLVGLVSFGKDCARPDYPGVYTKVSDYIPWIVDKLKP